MNETVMYRFKDIKPVINGKDLIDVVLSKTQRKTPTEVHKGFKIVRIRNFYMRKVKYCQELFQEKLNNIINDFPRLDDIHPFYADLANILYDRDHYKLALGQCNYTNKAIKKISHDYIKFLKFSSSLYKCKMLKIAALGRMCKLVKKLQSSLIYLEEVRQNLSRLPYINPYAKTILLSGFPNVGKSSFINLVSRANVDIQSYPFTTKYLYVGHFEYNMNKIQIIDTPGLLDRNINDRNTIEMTALTALTHINGLILFIIDISELCGYTIKEQVNLLYSLKPLYKNKSVLIGFNKIDKVHLDQLSEENKLIIKEISNNLEKENITLKFASFCTLTSVGIEEAKKIACEMLQQYKSSYMELNKNELIDKQLDKKFNNDRLPNIPESVIVEKLKLQLNENNENETNKKDLTLRELKLQKKNKSRQSYLSNRKNNKILEIDLQNQNGGPGVYSIDIRKNYDIKEEYKYDIIPEIYNGKNISDFIDEDIEKKLLELEKEEEEIIEKNVIINPLWFKTEKILERMGLRLKGIKTYSGLNKEKQPIYNKRHKRLEEIQEKLNASGIKNSENIIKSMTEKLKIKKSDKKGVTVIKPNSKKARKLNMLKKIPSQLLDGFIDEKNSNENNTDNTNKISKRNAVSDIYHDPNIKNKIYQSTSTALQRYKAYKLNKLAYRKIKKGAKGEADRSIPCKKPRHLFSGKRTIGKTSRR